MLQAHSRYSALGGAGQYAADLGNQTHQIGQAIGRRTDENNSNCESGQMLLKGQVSIDRDQHVESSLSTFKEIPVCPDREAFELPRQAAIYAFVKQDLQAASVVANVAPRSRNATTCSRVTDGKPSRKSSMVSPPSR